MSCNHKPVISFKNLLSRRPRYTCRNCGAEIEFTPAFNGISRSASMVLIMLLLLKVMGGNTSFGLTGTDKLLVDLGMMLGIVLIYLGAMLLLTRLGKFQEVSHEPEPPAGGQPVQSDEHTTYTQEQLDLIAMYREYELKAGINPMPAEPASTEPVVQAAQIVEAEDLCDHMPKAGWKNLIPGQFNFICTHCGKKITFPLAFKKRINMLLMLISFAVLIPFISDFSLKFWIFGLLTLLVIAIGVVIQFIIIKKGRFEIADDT